MVLLCCALTATADCSRSDRISRVLRQHTLLAREDIERKRNEHSNPAGAGRRRHLNHISHYILRRYLFHVNTAHFLNNVGIGGSVNIAAFISMGASFICDYMCWFTWHFGDSLRICLALYMLLLYSQLNRALSTSDSRLTHIFEVSANMYTQKNNQQPSRA